MSGMSLFRVKQGC